MKNSSLNISLWNLQLYSVCREDTVWTFFIVFGCIAVLCLFCQVVFAVLALNDKTSVTTIQQAMFMMFHFLLLTVHAISYLLQQGGQCGWIRLDDVSCKLMTWIKNFSLISCNCLLIFPWSQNHSIIQHTGKPFRVYISITMAILGIVTIPYAVFTEVNSSKLLVDGNIVNQSLCMFSMGHEMIIEIIEVICGTVVLSSLLFARITKDIISEVRKSKPREEPKNRENRRYSQPPALEAITAAKDKLNCRRMFYLNTAVAISYLICVPTHRYFDFVLFLNGNLATVHTLGTENISGVRSHGWQVLTSFFIVLPSMHGMCLLAAFIFTKWKAIITFRRRASQPIKRRLPIRQHTDTNFCRSIDEISEQNSEENSEVDNGSIADRKT